MTNATAITATESAPGSASWSAVFALSLCVATLIASEFMPVSLLTPNHLRPVFDRWSGGAGHRDFRHIRGRHQPLHRCIHGEA